MATRYHNVTGSTGVTVELLKPGDSVSGIKSILITNNHDSSSCVVQIQLYDGTNTYVINETDMPARSSLVLKEGIIFDSTVYDLRATTSTTANITIIVNK